MTPHVVIPKKERYMEMSFRILTPNLTKRDKETF